MTMEPFHITSEPASAGLAFRGMPATATVAEPRQSAMLLFGDPSSFPVDRFLLEVDQLSKGLRVMGGMASGGAVPGTPKLLLGDTMLTQGGVGVLLSGSVPIRSLVSPGCRPIGNPCCVTRAQDNLILELEGKPPLVQLEQLFRELDTRTQRLVQQELFIGRAIDEDCGASERGQFRLWGIRSLDRSSGALALNDRVSLGQIVQFLVHDAEVADEDLHRRLRKELAGGKASSALLFTCNRRGSRLFAQPHHDARVLNAEAGNIPVAGFFAEGEIGPVGGQNWCRSYTASVTLFGA